jgi:hypothetical protein
LVLNGTEWYAGVSLWYGRGMANPNDEPSPEALDQWRRKLTTLWEHDEQLARRALGQWLAAEPGRCWDCDDDSGQWVVYLELNAGVGQASSGTGPTLAVAICNALDKVSG